MDRDKLKIDSDKAIETARKEPLLEKQRSRQPAWNSNAGTVCRPESASLRCEAEQPQQRCGHRRCLRFAEDGKVLKNDLHINRVGWLRFVTCSVPEPGRYDVAILGARWRSFRRSCCCASAPTSAC
jgi:hypothetical protein